MPKVSSLQEALQSVIKSNTMDKYPPRRFIQIVSNTKNSQLVQVCTELIFSNSAFSEMSQALLKHPNLLTLEDFVGRYGLDWGFTKQTVEEANRRSQSFDCLVKNKRYE
jgi:hypothetical protein